MNKEFRSYLIVVISAFVITMVTLNFFSFYLVSGDSMTPTLNENNYLVVKKAFLNEKQYERGDIIVFHASVKNSLQNEKDLVKRIIAIQGDTVRIKNNQVYVNDEMITENYLKEDKTAGDLELIVKPNSYFVLGDNRKVSLDSRGSIGLVNKSEILGKVIIRMFPFEMIGDEMDEY